MFDGPDGSHQDGFRVGLRHAGQCCLETQYRLQQPRGFGGDHVALCAHLAQVRCEVVVLVEDGLWPGLLHSPPRGQIRRGVVEEEVAAEDLPHVLVHLDYREHGAEVHPGRFHCVVAFDITDRDPGVHQLRVVLEPGAIVHLPGQLQLANLVGQQFLGHDAEQLPRPLMVGECAGEHLRLVERDVVMRHA